MNERALNRRLDELDLDVEAVRRRITNLTKRVNALEDDVYGEESDSEDEDGTEE